MGESPSVKGAVTLLTLVAVLSGCGVMGPPVPPNTIGVNVKRRNDALERERRTQAQMRQDPGDAGAAPQRPAEQASTPSADMLLQGDVVQPAARPDSDFLVRPR